MKAAFYTNAPAPLPRCCSSASCDPQPGPGELRVRLALVGVNPSDVKSRAGLRSKGAGLPAHLPYSGMGSVDAVGAGVDHRHVGWKRAPTARRRSMWCCPSAGPFAAEGTPDEAGACLGILALTALHAV